MKVPSVLCIYRNATAFFEGFLCYKKVKIVNLILANSVIIVSHVLASSLWLSVGLCSMIMMGSRLHNSPGSGGHGCSVLFILPGCEHAVNSQYTFTAVAVWLVVIEKQRSCQVVDVERIVNYCRQLYSLMLTLLRVLSFFVLFLSFIFIFFVTFFYLFSY